MFNKKNVHFICNICATANCCHYKQLTREEINCIRCGSSVRTRSIVSALTSEFFDTDIILAELSKSKLKGIGYSDCLSYARFLEKKFAYSNTYYHEEPRLDIMDISGWQEGQFDFIISSEVFEHVNPPVNVAFKNTRKLLKKDGLLIISVPYGIEEHGTIEHFPDLYDYRVVEENGQYILYNTTKENKKQKFEHLIFHGGVGSTLEMRYFTSQSIIKTLTDVGYSDIKIHQQSNLQHGILWIFPWSITLSARANK